MNLEKLIHWLLAGVVRWLPTRGQVLRAGGTVMALAALAVLLAELIRLGYAQPWTGFAQSEVNQGVQPAKTLWDWLDLLIVPVVLAIGGYLFNSSQNRATQEAAEQRAQDDALQAYLDHMSDMLIPKKDQPSLYRAHPGDSLSSVARARTLTVLSRLDREHKPQVLQFLKEAGLIAKDAPIVDLRKANLRDADLLVAHLEDANLRDTNLVGADLAMAYLIGTDLEEARLMDANLFAANLSHARLTGSRLEGAYLGGADLKGTNLTRADLARTDLTSASLRRAKLKLTNLREANLLAADLRAADLRGAVLRGAYLHRTDLRGAVLKHNDLRDADLWKAQVSEEILKRAGHLEGATMPNGQKYEGWIKDREGGKEDADSD